KELQIAATSFTGKATSHLKSNIFKHAKNVQIEAKTLHSLLNLREGKNKFFKDQKIDFDLILVDESSMIDIKLMAYLLDAIKKGTRIVFIGDPNQLPPIVGGNLFKEIVDVLPNQASILKRAHRFDNNIILDLAKAIDLENEKNIVDILDNKIDFFDIETINAAKNNIFDMAKDNFFEPQNKKLQISNVLNRINDFRILSSIKKGPFGVDTLNKEIFSIFYRKAKTDDFLYVPIIITKNNYKLDLYNGQVGILSYQKTDSGLTRGIAHFQMDGQVKSYSIYYLNSFEYAYAISIHKSQGSEFEKAIVIIPETQKSFSKELFYTAVTRVKNKLYLISSKKIIFDLIKKQSFKKSALSKRYS
ncbi:MAG: hypothetical protein K1000chlam1_01432, partial [Candidatus Anoxychlamydiales bacterium]|nr:hypothetical protein [Candidatus Anoxychlamydiales bacterium]